MHKDWDDAVRKGDALRIREMLSVGVDVDSLDRYGQTALMRCSRDGFENVIEVLLHAGARLDVTAKFGLSALMLAVINQRARIVGRLLDAGADVRLRGTGEGAFYGKTAADLARANGQPDVAALIETKRDDEPRR